MSMWVFNRGVNPELTQEALESFLLLLKESRKQIKVVLSIYLFIYLFIFHFPEFLREPTRSKKARGAWA